MTCDMKQYPDFRAAIIWALFGLMLLLASCRTSHVPVETVRTVYQVRDSIRYDSIYRHDSIYIRLIGDTVYKYISKVDYKYLYLTRRDTLATVDTIRIREVVEVPAKLTRWQRAKMQLGGWAIMALVLTAFYGAYRLYRYFRP